MEVIDMIKKGFIIINDGHWSVSSQTPQEVSSEVTKIVNGHNKRQCGIDHDKINDFIYKLRNGLIDKDSKEEEE